MEEMNTISKNKLPETKNSPPKKSFPAAPEIETPVPPQVMDPSTLPDTEWDELPLPRGKRKRNRV